MTSRQGGPNTSIMKKGIPSAFWILLGVLTLYNAFRGYQQDNAVWWSGGNQDGDLAPGIGTICGIVFLIAGISGLVCGGKKEPRKDSQGDGA
jgi:hypothetical protein